MERRHLVYVLPGIGGSVLERPAGGGGWSTAWDAGFGDIKDLVLNPGRLSVDEHEHLRPVGLIDSKHLLPGWPVVHGYNRLVRELAALPGVRLDAGHPDARVPDANVVLFPYDFRRSLAEAAQRLDADVRVRLEALGGDPLRRVVIVAHSLGGLVARFWMGPLQGWRLCRALATLGTPHRGAPKALDVVANGVPIGVGRLAGPARMLAGWASVGELMPAYQAVWDLDAQTALYPHELLLASVASLAGAGYGVHRQINEAWSDLVPRSGPEVRAYFGYSHATARSAVWSGGSLRVLSGAPQGVGPDLLGWEQDLGDGTVPAFSAVPVESSGHDVRDLRVRDKHTPLAVNTLIGRLLEFYEGRADITAVQGASTADSAGAAPVLGVDVGELHAAGTPVPVQVAVRHAVGPVEQVPVWVQAFPADGVGGRAALAEVRAVWDPKRQMFAAELSGLGPGLFDVVVKARSVPGAGDLVCADAFGVVEP